MVQFDSIDGRKTYTPLYDNTITKQKRKNEEKHIKK
jgi:hypothetical protein